MEKHNLSPVFYLTIEMQQIQDRVFNVSMYQKFKTFLKVTMYIC